MHRSDRGSQYTSLAFGKTLRESGLVVLDGLAWRRLRQRCLRELKREWIKRHRYTSRHHARLSIFQYIETFYYTPRRRHSAPGGVAPTSTRGVA